MFNFKKIAAVAALSTLSVSAVAVPLSGGVSFSSVDSGLFTWDADANSFNFADSNAQVDAVSGDFATDLSVGDVGTFYDFEYDADFAAGTLWDFGGLQFSLEEITNVFEASSFVGIEGVGTITDGVDSITSNLAMTAQTAGGTFSWSSSNEVAVSEPSTLGIFSLAMLALSSLSFARRNKK